MIGRIIAFISVIILMPLFLVIMVAIKIDSKGPSIFKQQRVGQFGNLFTIYKFRTMVTGTPDLPSELVGQEDQRITKLGKFLRRFSFDELPQLINILKGDMCFIGPRPALYNQDLLISLRNKAGVNILKPGVTGWAQVNGRDNIALEKKVELDTYYLHNHSLLLDVKIIWLTLLKSFAGSDLYYDKEQSNVVTQSKSI